MGYKYFYLHENVVPKDYSIVIEKEQIDIAMLKSKENYNTTSKSVSETYVWTKVLQRITTIP